MADARAVESYVAENHLSKAVSRARGGAEVASGPQAAAAVRARRCCSFCLSPRPVRRRRCPHRRYQRPGPRWPRRRWRADA